jgi:hypothetical protein
VRAGASPAFWFLREGTTPEEDRHAYDAITAGESVKLKPALQEVLDL